MKALILLALLMQARKQPELNTLPADIDAVAEARRAQRLLLENEVLRVYEVKVPPGVKELHFAPRMNGKTGEFFVLGGSRVIWLDGPLIIRTECLHVEFVQPVVAKPVAAKDGILFENSLIRVRHMGRGEGGELKWLAKERVLQLKQGPHRMRVELKF